MQVLLQQIRLIFVEFKFGWRAFFFIQTLLKIFQFQEEIRHKTLTTHSQTIFNHKHFMYAEGLLAHNDEKDFSCFKSRTLLQNNCHRHVVDNVSITTCCKCFCRKVGCLSFLLHFTLELVGSQTYIIYWREFLRNRCTCCMWQIYSYLRFYCARALVGSYFS